MAGTATAAPKQPTAISSSKTSTQSTNSPRENQPKAKATPPASSSEGEKQDKKEKEKKEKEKQEKQEKKEKQEKQEKQEKKEKKEKQEKKDKPSKDSSREHGKRDLDATTSPADEPKPGADAKPKKNRDGPVVQVRAWNAVFEWDTKVSVKLDLPCAPAIVGTGQTEIMCTSKNNLQEVLEPKAVLMTPEEFAKSFW